MPFAFFCRGWKTTTPNDGFDSLCFLDTQGKGNNMVHEISCPGVACEGNDAYPEGSLCVHITRLIISAKGLLFCSNSQGNTEKEEWDLVRRIANPYLSPRADSYLTIGSKALKQIGSIGRLSLIHI